MTARTLVPPGTPALQKTKLDAVAVGGMAVLCACWGVQQVTTKIALAGGMPPMFQATARSVIATALLLGWIAWRSDRRRALLVRDGTLWPGLLVAVLFAAEFLFLFPGVARTSASRAVLFLFTAPFFTVLGAHFFLPAERLTSMRAAGLLVAFAGVVAAASDRLAEGATWQGDALVLAAAASLGVTTVVLKASPALAGATAAKVLLWQVGGSIPLLAVAAIALGQAGWPNATRAAWVSLSYQSVVVAFASYLTWFWLVARYPAGRLAAFTFMTPLIGIAVAGVVLGDPVTSRLLLGVVGVGAGLQLVNRG